MMNEKPIRMEPRNVNHNEYWKSACTECKISQGHYVEIFGRKVYVRNDRAGHCGSCFATLSELRKDGKPFYLV